MSRIRIGFPTLFSMILVLVVAACGPKISPLVPVPEINLPAGLNAVLVLSASPLFNVPSSAMVE